MDDFIHGKPPFSFYFQFLVYFLVLLNKLVSLYEISSNPVMGVASVVVLFLGMKNCSYWLKFKTQHCMKVLKSRMQFTLLDQECSSQTMSE